MAHLRVGDAFVQSPLGTVLFFAACGTVVYIIGRNANLLPAWRLHASPMEKLVLRSAIVLLIAVHWVYLILSGVAV